jgi:hypothetical protein
MYELLDISLGNFKITEYINKSTQEVEKIYIQNGIVGFYASEEEIKDLCTLLNYYIDIEKINDIR